MAHACARAFRRRKWLRDPPVAAKKGEEAASKWMPPLLEGKLAAKFPRGIMERAVSSEVTTRDVFRKGEVENLWRELFSDPTQWRDHRLEKVNPRFPDFKHKKTQKALWLDSGWIPPWVKAKLDAIPPGTIESSAFSWNQRLSRHVQDGEYEKTMEIFQNMQRDGIIADRCTFFPVLKACASLGLVEYGRRIHKEIMQPGLETDLFIGSSLVDMYVKCGSMADAWSVFNQMPKRDVVAWTSMILGYVKFREALKALELFEQMQQERVAPRPITFIGVLNACASLAALEEGRRAHEEIVRRGYESDVAVGNCLVHMYAKCGSIEEAKRVFDQMPTKTVVAWSAMIMGYGSHGYAKEAVETFKRMPKSVEVDGVTFISLLSACNHGGLVEEGLQYFKSMNAVYDITPTVEHYTCVVDLLGRAGRVREAEDLIRNMPLKPDATIWTSLLGACRVHGNLEIAERCANRLMELDSDKDTAYVLLSNIYAAADQSNSKARQVCEVKGVDRGAD